MLFQIEVDGVSVRLQIWDTAGQERYASMMKTYYRKAKVQSGFKDPLLNLCDSKYQIPYPNTSANHAINSPFSMFLVYLFAKNVNPTEGYNS